MGSITRLGERRYRLRVEVAPDPDAGTRRWHSESCHGTRKTCERRLATLTADPAEIASGEPLAVYLTERWLPHYARTFRASSYRQRSSQVRVWLVPHLGDVPLGKLTAGRIERALTAMRAAGASPTTVRDVLGCLRAALHTAVRWELIPRNPASTVRAPEVHRVRRAIWTPAQTGRFLASGSDVFWMLWRLVARTAMRGGEARAVRWSDVDWSVPSIRVERTWTSTDDGERLGPPKSEAGRREVVIGAVLVDELRTWRSEQTAERWAAGLPVDPDSFICSYPDGRHLPAGTVRARWKAAVAAAGLPPATVHDLRHLGASVQLAAGAPLKTVSARLGHGTVGITADLYGHVLREHQRAAADVLDSAFTAPVAEEPTPIRDEG